MYILESDIVRTWRGEFYPLKYLLSHTKSDFNLYEKSFELHIRSTFEYKITEWIGAVCEYR